MLDIEVPTAKVFFHRHLLSNALKGEDEHLVLGGGYEVATFTL